MWWIASPSAHGAAGQLLWLCGAAMVGFTGPAVFVWLLSLPRGWFVLAHGLISGVLIWSYGRWAGFDREEARRNWLLGIAGGLLAGMVLVGFVVSQPDSPGPQGYRLLWEIIWLGFVYGLVDAALLTIVPVHAVWAASRAQGWLQHWLGWPVTAMVALLASLGVTTAYHLGFPEFQGARIVQPIIGNAVVSLAYILTSSPLAAATAHIALHVSAAMHAYATSIPLPPHY